MKEIQVTVVIPVYNALEFVAQAIESVMAQQVVCEIIIAEDPSANQIGSLVRQLQAKSYPIKYFLNEKRLGVAANRNLGVRKASGKYIAFLDADDWWDKEKLKEQLSLIEACDAPFVFCGRELMSHEGIALGKQISVPVKVDYKKLLKGNVIPCSSVLLKAQIAKKYPQHHPEFHEDYIMWLEILKNHGQAYGIDKPFLKSRLSAQGKSRNKLKSAQMTWSCYRVLGIPFLKSCYYFCHYAFRGFGKYR